MFSKIQNKQTQVFNFESASTILNLTNSNIVFSVLLRRKNLRMDLEDVPDIHVLRRKIAESILMYSLTFVAVPHEL